MCGLAKAETWVRIPLVAPEDKMRCFQCRNKFPSFYMSNSLCHGCYDKEYGWQYHRKGIRYEVCKLLGPVVKFIYKPRGKKRRNDKEKHVERR